MGSLGVGLHGEHMIEVGGGADWLALAAQTAHVAVGVSRACDGVLIEANEAFCRLFGYPRKQLLGRSSAELVLWPDPQRRQGMLELLQRNGAVNGYSMPYRNAAGETGQLEISARIVSREGVPHLIGFLTDVTDRHELIEGLRAAQGRLGVALRASSMLVFRQDRALRYTWVANPALGVSEADVLGRTDVEMLGAEAAAPLVAIKQRVLDSGRAQRRDVWVANNGQLGCFDLVVEPERDGAGRVVGIVCAALDITQRMTQHTPRPPSQRTGAAAGGPGPAAGQDRPPDDDAQRVTAQLRAQHAGRLVVVAAHNAVLRELTAALLEHAGLRVAPAASGVEAFSLTLQLAPDLLLLDMEMPQRGAVAAARAIRTMVGHRLPLLAMVTAAPQVDAGLALDADLDDVIVTPVHAAALYARVLAWLETGRCPS